MANINQNYDGQTRLKDWWKTIKSNLGLMNDQTEKHISGEADRHRAQDVDYSGSISGQTTVKGAVEQVQANLNAHKTNATLDHPDGSVKTTKIADGAITDAKIGSRTINKPDADGTTSGTLTALLNVITGAARSLLATVTAHINSKSNPHGVTKAQVGLGNANDTSDANKPVSTATQTALNGKVDKVTGKGLSTNDYTTAEKTKLAGIAANANNYTHPASHPASMITQDSTHRFATDAEKTAWNNKLAAGNIKAGSNVTVTTSGNNVTISSTGGGEGPGITVVDNLTSTSTTDALSANQGRVLKSAVDGKAASSHTHTKLQITDFPASMTPTVHTSTGTTYGAGTSSYYGHVRLYNNLTTSSSGSAALDAYQGKVLDDKKLESSNILAGDNISLSKSGKNVTISASGGGCYSGSVEYTYTSATPTGDSVKTIPVPSGMHYALVYIHPHMPSTGQMSHVPFGVQCLIDKDNNNVIVMGNTRVDSSYRTAIWNYGMLGYITTNDSASNQFGGRALQAQNSNIKNLELTDEAIKMTINIESLPVNTANFGYFVEWMVW